MSRTIRIDFRFTQIEYELWALGHMLNVIEPTIVHLAAQDEATTLGELREHGWEHDEAEVQIALQELSEKRERVLPRFMRGPFLIALWACFESALSDVARILQKEQNVVIALREVRGETPLKRARRYFEAVLRVPLDTDPDRMERLGDLYRIRNAFAHGNGLRTSMSEEAWQKLQGALRRQNLAIDRPEVVVLTEDYVRNSFDDVNRSLRELIGRVR